MFSSGFGGGPDLGSNALRVVDSGSEIGLLSFLNCYNK